MTEVVDLWNGKKLVLVTVDLPGIKPLTSPLLPMTTLRFPIQETQRDR
jgi:hypothetical protein